MQLNVIVHSPKSPEGLLYLQRVATVHAEAVLKYITKPKEQKLGTVCQYSKFFQVKISKRSNRKTASLTYFLKLRGINYRNNSIDNYAFIV